MVSSFPSSFFLSFCSSSSSFSSLPGQIAIKGFPSSLYLAYAQRSFCFSDKFKYLAQRNPNQGLRGTTCRACCFMGVTVPPSTQFLLSNATISGEPLYVHEVSHSNLSKTSEAASELLQRLVLADLDPATAKLAIVFLGPFLSAFAFLFIIRIVMSWYPKLPVGKFPYVLAYAPTEPILSVTRKLIPPLGGVDVTPVVWFGLVSFLNEILVGPQGLLVLVSQQA